MEALTKIEHISVGWLVSGVRFESRTSRIQKRDLQNRRRSSIPSCK